MLLVSFLASAKDAVRLHSEFSFVPEFDLVKKESVRHAPSSTSTNLTYKTKLATIEISFSPLFRYLLERLTNKRKNKLP